MSTQLSKARSDNYNFKAKLRAKKPNLKIESNSLQKITSLVEDSQAPRGAKNKKTNE